MQLLKSHGLPAPEPLYLDDTGAILGSPGIVTRFMPGRLILTQPYPPQWAETLARTVHIDYWSGNILWNQDRISAVVDWEEASQGDPGIDVAYCRMDMILGGMKEAADTFLATYEKETGKTVANLGLWELAAAVRPMFHPEGWISEFPSKERFADFVDAAIERTRRASI